MSRSAGLTAPPLWPGEREGLLAAVWLKHFFLPPPVSFVKALQGSLALCRNLHFFRDILNDTHLPLVSPFQGSRNRVRASVKQKAACFGMTF